MPPARARHHDREERRIFESGAPTRDRIEKVSRPGGRHYWFSHSKALVRDQEGCPVGLVGTTRDVTARVMVERQRDVLLDVTRKLVELHTFDEAAEAVLETICKAAEIKYAEAWRLKAEVPTRWSVAARFVNSAAAETYREKTCRGEWAFDPLIENLQQTGSSLIVLDPKETKSINRNLRSIIQDCGFRSIIAAPVRNSDGTILSCLIFFGNAENDTKSQRSELLDIVCRQLGIFLKSKLDEDRVRENEKNLSAVLETQTELLTRVKPDGTRLFVNPAFERFLNIPKEEILNLTPFNLVSEEYHERIRKDLYNLTPEIPERTLTVQMRRHDGALRWIEWRARGIFDDAGQLIEIQASGRDTTDRVDAQNQARQSHQILLDAINALPVGFALYDSADRLLMFNGLYRTDRPKHLRNMVKKGVTAECLARRMAESGLYIQFGSDVESQTARRMELWRERPNRYVVQYSDGCWKEFLQVPASNGCTVVLRSDITAKKKDERSLAISEAKFRDFAEIASDWMWEADEEGRVLAVHGSAASSTGVDPARIVADWWQEYSRQPIDETSGLRSLQSSIELSFEDATSAPRIYAVNAKCHLDDDLSKLRYRGTVSDITARREAERLVQESETKLRSILDNADDSIFLHDQEGRIIEANKAAERSLGYPFDAKNLEQM